MRPTLVSRNEELLSAAEIQVWIYKSLKELYRLPQWKVLEDQPAHLKLIPVDVVSQEEGLLFAEWTSFPEDVLFELWNLESEEPEKYGEFILDLTTMQAEYIEDNSWPSLPDSNHPKKAVSEFFKERL